MPHTRSASVRAAGGGERCQQQEQQERQPKNLVASPALGNGLLTTPRSQGTSVPPTKSNDNSSNNNSNNNSNNIISSSNNSNSNVIVARAATPASTRDRPSFDPVPMECPRFPSPCRQHEQTAANDISSTRKTSDSSSRAIIDVGSTDTKTNDNHTDAEGNPMNSSVASIELAGLLDGASLSLPPLGEIFSPDQKQQQQQHDLSPIPLIHGSSSNPDTAVFDFDVNEIDAMIGELVEEHDEEHKQHLTNENRGQHSNLQQPQEEEGQQQQQQQQEEDQQQGQKQDERQQDDEEQKEQVGEVEGQQGTSSSAATATAAAAAAAATTDAAVATFAAPLKAVLMDGPVREALEGAMSLTQRAEANTTDAFAHACAVAVQKQVEVRLAWQQVLTTVHTAAVLLRADNVKLLASKDALEAEKRGMAAHINDLENRVSVLIAERDCLAAKLKESGAGSSAESRSNGNGNGNSDSNSHDNDNGCLSLDAGGLGVSPAAPPGETTIDNRASADATAIAAPVTAIATPASLPALASGTATGQQNSMMTTATAAVAIDVLTTTPTMTMTMAPQQCEVGLVIPTAPPSVGPSAVAAVTVLPTTASTAEPATPTTTNNVPRPSKVSSPVASITAHVAAAAAPTPNPTATKLQPQNETEKPTRRVGKVGDFAIKARASSIGGGVRSTTFPSPSAVGNKGQAVSPPPVASSAERRGSVVRRSPWVGGGVGGAVFPSPPAVVNKASAMSPSPAAFSAEMRGSVVRRAPRIGGGVGGAVFPSPPAVGNKAQAMSAPPVASSTERRGSVVRHAPRVGGGVGGTVFPSPSAVGNTVQVMSPPPAASSSERRGGAARRATAATRSPLSAVNTNTTCPAVPLAAMKVRKAAVPCVAKPSRASLTRGTESTKTAAAAVRTTAKVPAKRIVSDDRGADGNRPKPEGMYGRLRSASRQSKNDAKVVAGGGQKVVSGPGVSTRSRQETATNKGAAGRRAKVVPKKRWV